MCTEWPEAELKESPMKSTLHIPSFRPFRSTISRFQDITHFRIFPIDSQVKISKCHKILSFLSDRQNVHKCVFPYDCLIYHKVLWSDKICRRSSVLKFSAPYGHMLTKISMCHKSFKFLHIKKSISLYSLMTNLLRIKFDWNWMKTVGAAPFEHPKIDSFGKIHRMTLNWAHRITHEKYPTYSASRVPNFHPFCSTISHFQDTVHFRIFPLTLMLKFENFKDRQNIHNFIIIMTALFIIKLGSDRKKTAGLVAFWNVYTPIGSHVNEKEKENHKNFKNENFEKRKKVWRYGG